MDDNKIHELIDEKVDKAVRQTSQAFNGHLKTISQQLDRFEKMFAEQATQLRETNDLFRIQNGRVTALQHNAEISYLRKEQDCPFKDKINSIVDHTTAMKAINKAMYKAVGITSLVVGIVLGIGKMLGIF